MQGLCMHEKTHVTMSGKEQLFLLSFAWRLLDYVLIKILNKNYLIIPELDFDPRVRADIFLKKYDAIYFLCHYLGLGKKLEFEESNRSQSE